MFVNFWKSLYQQVYNSDVAKRHYKHYIKADTQHSIVNSISLRLLTSTVREKGFIELFIENESTKKFAWR